MVKKQASFPYLFWILVFYLICIAGVMVWFGFKSLPGTNTPQQITNLPTPTPTPIKLPSGKGTYAVSQGKHTGPTIDKVTFDPLDVRSGQTLTITVQVSNAPPVQTIQGSLSMDTTTKDLSFTRASTAGTFDIWQTTIPIDDTLWYTYALRVNAQNANGVSTLTITPR